LPARPTPRIWGGTPPTTVSRLPQTPTTTVASGNRRRIASAAQTIVTPAAWVAFGPVDHSSPDEELCPDKTEAQQRQHEIQCRHGLASHHRAP